VKASDDQFGEGRPKAIHAAIAHDLGITIVGGKLRPGAPLPGEERFSAEQRVSRSAYREAVKILAAKGLVHSRTKSGTRVNERSSWNMLDRDVLAWIFKAGPHIEFIQGIFELRRIVEPEAASLAAVRRSEHELADMGHALEEMRHWGLLKPEGRAADERFHTLILQATRNEPLIALAGSIAAAVKWTSKFAREEREQHRDPMPDHFAVYDALARSDSDKARKWMVDLISNASHDAGLVTLGSGGR
jgi:DNA-binding FadR family transcriptional regulator